MQTAGHEHSKCYIINRTPQNIDLFVYLIFVEVSLAKAAQSSSNTIQIINQLYLMIFECRLNCSENQQF